VDPGADRHEGKPKFKYLLPLDGEIAERIEAMSKPYPKYATSKEIVAPEFPPGEGGESDSGAPVIKGRLLFVTIQSNQCHPFA
jgi:hypothetical protein